MERGGKWHIAGNCYDANKDRHSEQVVGACRKVEKRVVKMNIIERLKEKYPEMTKKQKQIAEYMMSHVDKMSFITLKESKCLRRK